MQKPKSTNCIWELAKLLQIMKVSVFNYLLSRLSNSHCPHSRLGLVLESRSLVRAPWIRSFIEAVAKDIQRDFVESFFEARSDASFIVKKYYTKILTECPNILIRKFKIRENVNNIGESIGTAQNHILNRIEGK